MDTMPKPTAPAPAAANTQPRPRIASEDLLRGNSALEIEHAGQRYLLRVTRENKLILTK
ncbi:MAG: hemin uptake protein HemP [Dechloromonas sp.]|nr:hemin uptake protein HemP [Dechloromonas sp.]